MFRLVVQDSFYHTHCHLGILSCCRYCFDVFVVEYALCFGKHVLMTSFATDSSIVFHFSPQRMYFIFPRFIVINFGSVV